MLWETRYAASVSGGGPRMVPIHSRAQRPRADIDLWVLSDIHTRGPMTLRDLVARVADHMYHEALSQGAATVDIGIFGAKLFHAEAAAVVARGDGKWWAIEKRD